MVFISGYNREVSQATKQIIIIPGSCSSRSNWFDQINHYQDQGYQVDFLELDVYKAASLVEAASNVYFKLKSVLQGESVIMAHSMGAMLLLKILSEPKFYRAENPELFQKILESKLIFLQVPLSVNPGILGVMSVTRFLLYPILFVYRLLLFWLIDFVLILFKYLLAMITKLVPLTWYLLAPLNLSLNLSLMMNSFFGTRPKELANLIKFYKHWQDFSLDGFFAPQQEGNAFDKAMIGAAENTMDKFSKSNSANYYFTCGFTDAFCDAKQAQIFVDQLGANLVRLDYGFHNPQHMFWHQGRINELVIK